MNKNTFLSLAFILIAIFTLQGCGGGNNNPTRVEFTPPAPFNIESNANVDSSYTTSDGLQIYIIEEGYGPFKVIARDQVSVFYTGRVIKNGDIDRVFDSSYQNNNSSPRILQNLTKSPISTGSGRTVSPLIDGFRRAILGMRAGGKRVVIIPPSLGYEDAQEGSRGYQLRNDTLRFDIELETILD
ncbi:FKBP-type peptidyl-prolyl cis-trans isomerase [Fodinibius salinus]|uniref:FKBP-type peptidyl-prolyl cis-trans isomerase n=1 Tax=Fodinibius salinus TaxID=860790 RepID=UPI0014790030|nr:FKBP-type peptidyl-prolyl cis-trans isomerase [Fodinibius salinus]